MSDKNAHWEAALPKGRNEPSSNYENTSLDAIKCNATVIMTASTPGRHKPIEILI